MNFVFKLFGLISIVFLLSVSCTEENQDTTPPQQITGLNSIAKNQKVLLEWTNPTDNDFEKTVVSYGSTTIEIIKTENTVLIEGLENGTEYTFELQCVDKNGNKSTSITTKATPDDYVTTYAGREYESGTFLCNDQFPRDIIIDGNKYHRTMRNILNDAWIWDGTVSKTNDTTYVFNYEYHSDDIQGITHIANIENTINSILCYDVTDTTFYIEGAYEKIDGDSGFIVGNYKEYSISISDDEPTYNNTTYTYIEFKANGEVIYKYSYTSDVENDTWNNNDLLNETYIFVTLNNRTFLINKKKIVLFIKQ